MAIEEYGITYFYGFGVFSGHNIMDNNYCRDFTKEITIRTVMGKITFDTGMKPITLPKRNNDGVLVDECCPLFIVLENGVWKEYFTGEQLKVYTGKFFYDNMYDLSCFNASDNFESFGVREFVICNIEKQNVKSFSEYISKYSEEDIQMMVAQFYDLKEKAKLWGPRFEHEVKVLLNEVNVKKSTLSKEVESKIGKYSIDRNKQRENKIHLGNQSEHNDSDNLEKRKVSSIIFISVIVILFVLLLYMR